MNNRDKLQKFSIRKYAIGTFSTVIATLVFVGFNPGQAHANEVSQSQKVMKQQEDSPIDEDNSNSKAQQSNKSHQLNRQVDNNQSRSSENNQQNALDKTTLTNNDENQNAIQSLESEQASTNSDENNINNQSSLSQEDLRINNDVIRAKKQEDEEKETQDSSKKDNHKMNKQQLAEKRANKDDKNKESIKDKDKNGQVHPPIDKNRLQSLLDSSYHDYKMIDKDKSNPTEFNKVKAAFDKANELLGKEDNTTSDELTIVYQELVQAIELARTLPQRNQEEKIKRPTRSTNSNRSAETERGISPYMEANTEYYVPNNEDGSSYPVGTFLHASNRRSPYNLPKSRNILKASDVRNNAYITAKREKDGYRWDVLFNMGHRNHEYNIYWFGIPRDQTPVGRVTMTIINKDGSATSYDGSGSGSGQPLPKFWQTAGGINSSVAREFKHGSATNYPFYNNEAIHVNSFTDFARGGPLYFDRTGATKTNQAFGDQTFQLLNGEQPNELQGLDSIYSFMGSGEVSYRISFTTHGLPTNRLYYAAGARSLEYNQISNYNQLYVENLYEYHDRIKGFTEVKNRTLHLGNTVNEYDSSIGRYTNRPLLDDDGSHIKNFADDPLSFVKNISGTVLGFMPQDSDYNHVRPQGVNPLQANQIHDMLSEEKLREAARTGRPIRLMIGFDAYDKDNNPETIVPVNLTVKPAIQQNIKLWHNNEGRSMDTYTEAKQAGHPLYSVMAGEIYNKNVNQQDIRIQFTSNESFNDNNISVYSFPNTLRLEEAAGRTNNNTEKNLALAGTLEPGDYFITARIGFKEQQFEVRAKPSPPQITTTSLQIKSQNTRRPKITLTHVTPKTNAKVLLVTGGQNGETNAFANPYTKPTGYTIIASAPATYDGNVTIAPNNYIRDLPRNGTIKAITYFNDNVQSNFSNEINLITDNTPPKIGEPVGLNSKYYRDNQVTFTVPVEDNHGGSGVNQVTVEGLPTGWTQSFVKNTNGQSGTLRISGTINHNNALNSVIQLRVIASDNDTNVTTDNQIKTININVGSLAADYPLVPLSNGDKILIVNPTQISYRDKNIGKEKLQNANTNKTEYLSSTNALVSQDNGDILVNYKDGSQATINAGNIFTYNPIRKDIYSDTDVTDPKVATIFVPKGARYEIGRDMRKYFSLSNGQNIPTNTSFTYMFPIDTLPTPDQISHFGDETHSYSIMAINTYNKASTKLTLRIKAVDVVAPSGNLRVYRLNPSTLSDDEVKKVKLAFMEANRKLGLDLNDITVNNPISGGASTVNVVIRKDKYNKTFTSHPGDMNFLRWTDIQHDYNITWSNNKLPNRVSDIGLSWSPDHKSIIYKYDATNGIPINLSQLLPLLNAHSNIAELRSDIFGNEKSLAIAGGEPTYKSSGYSTKENKLDNLRFYTKNGEIIQVLDLVQSTTGAENAEVSNSNHVYNDSNSQLINGEVPSSNGASAFQVEKVIKPNNNNNGVMNAIYKAQLVLTPYGAKQYIERIGSTMESTQNVINVYFVPIDNIPPTISFSDFNNHEVFSGETFRASILASDNYGIKSVSVPNDSGISVNLINNNTQISGVAPNVTSETTKTIKLNITDKSDNQNTGQLNVLIKPLKDKYRITSSITNHNPIRLNNIENGARLTSQERQAILDAVTVNKNVSSRDYITEQANEVRSKEVSNVIRPRDDATVNVTVTYNDGSSSQITIPVKHVLPEVVSEPRYTVKGQNFPQGKGAEPRDFFKLQNGNAFNARVNWIGNNTPNFNNSQIGVDIPLEAEIWFDGETTPIRKQSSYKIVKSEPKKIFETTINGQFVNSNDNPDNAGSYIKSINNSWPTGMNFDWAQVLQLQIHQELL